MTDIVMGGDAPELTSTSPAVVLATVTRSGHTFGALIAAWLGEAADSPNTRDAYERDLVEFCEWCEQRGLDPLEARFPDVTAYGVELADNPSTRTGSPLAPQTRARKLAAVSSFYSHLVRAGVLDANPASDVRRPEYDRSQPSAHSINHAEPIIQVAGEHPTLGTHCASLLLALLSLGIRATEVCALNDNDRGQNGGAHTVAVRRAGGRVHAYTLPRQMSELVDRYLAERPPAAPGDEDAPVALLRSLDGRRVSRYQIRRLIRRQTTP